MRLKINKRLTIVSALVLITAFSWWLLRGLTPVLKIDRAASSNEPDYFLENFKVQVMGENGRPQRDLSADSMHHYPLDDRATLDNPHMIFYNNDVASWDIRAEGGLVTEGGKSVFLSGDVLIQSIDRTDREGMEIITSDLMVKPEEDYAETKQPVQIRDFHGVTDAIGMHAHLKTRRLALLSQVKGVYDPVRD